MQEQSALSPSDQTPGSAEFRFLPPLWLESAESTNDIVKDGIRRAEPLPVGLVVAAREQTRGRGRMGNSWLSTPGRSLTFSFLWAGDAIRDPARVGTLPQAVALGVADFLSAAGARCRIKWPNDVLAEGGKICGILAESAVGAEGRPALAMGVGVNLGHDPDLAGRVGLPVASLEGESGTALDPEAALPPLLDAVGARIAAWERTGFPGIRRDLETILWGKGKTVRIRTAAGSKEGIMTGLAENGELVLRGRDGELFTVNSVSALEPEPARP